VLTLSALQPDGAAADGASAGGTPDAAAEVAREVVREAVSSDARSARDEHADASVPDDARVGAPEPTPSTSVVAQGSIAADADARAEARDSASSPDDAGLVAAAQALTQEVSPASGPLSSQQRDMLDRKLRRWARVDSRSPTGSTDSWTQRGQAYVATVSDEPASDDTAMDRRVIRISTQTGDGTLSTEIRMRRLAFSHYAQFVDRWDPLVELHDDALDGRFHSNSEIMLNLDRRATPTFSGRVTTAARHVNFGTGRGRARGDEIFRGGLETGITPIRLPDRFVPFPHVEPREDGIRYFNADARVTFHADGGYAWEELAGGSGERRAIIAGDVAYLIAAAGVTLHVRGTVRGKVLVYSPEGIVVEDDLVYARDPRAGGEDGDYLGLVSDKTVEVATQELTGPGDLTIDAAIYAKRAFVVRGYGVSNDGALVVYGSLAAGSLAATEPRYRTRVRFDPRLETLRPPSFPLTDRYEVESWDGLWRVEEKTESR
jgi:hypothetical protein